MDIRDIDMLTTQTKALKYIRTIEFKNPKANR